MIFKFLTKKNYINLLIIFFIFCLDRISKKYVIYLNEQNLSQELFVSKYLNINLIWNEGIAFGLLSFEQSSFYNFLTIFIAFIIFIILYMVIKTDGLKRYSLLIIIGGALGNLYDRAIFFAVPDFIDLHYLDYHWFVFNVSDIIITVGVILLLLKDIFSKKNV